MKLYYFKPKMYGQEYFVMSDSEENAIEAVKKFIEKECKEFYVGKESIKRGIEDALIELDKYIDGTEGSIKECDVNEVISSEIC